MLKLISTAMLAALLLTACGEPSGQAPAPAAWQIDQAPGTAVSILHAKANAQEGETVTITGLIGGKAEGSITLDGGLFLLVDASIPNCAQINDDHCLTPWDYCCEPRESLTAGMATVSVQDANGNPINLAGLKPASKVTVSGTVGPRPNEKVLTVTTNGVYVDEPAG